MGSKREGESLVREDEVRRSEEKGKKGGREDERRSLVILVRK